MILGDTPGKIANSLVLGIVLLGIATLSSAYGDTVLWHHTYDNGGHLLFAAIIRDWRFAIYESHTSAE